MKFDRKLNGKFSLIIYVHSGRVVLQDLYMPVYLSLITKIDLILINPSWRVSVSGLAS